MAMDVRVDCARRPFTADEYMRMVEVGILGKDERIELIRGEILTMSPIGPRHCAFVDAFNYLLVTALGERAWVRVQGTVWLFADTMPEPDLTIFRRRGRSYREAHPMPQDILFIIEVADTSLTYDRRAKLALYAEAGIPEYWVVDADAEAIEVHREPEGQRYRHSTRVTGTATVSPLAFPDAVLRLPDIFA
jgi:Uma2 family endonuclease